MAPWLWRLRWSLWGWRLAKAAAVIESLWETETGVISTQVLQEFYVTVTRKIKNPLNPDEAREIIRNYLAWPVQINDPETTIRASEIAERTVCLFGMQ